MERSYFQLRNYITGIFMALLFDITVKTHLKLTLSPVRQNNTEFVN